MTRSAGRVRRLSKTRGSSRVGSGGIRNLTGRAGSILFGSVRFCSVHIGLVRFGLVWFGLVRFGSVRFGSVRFGSVRFGSVRFGSVRFGSVRFSSGRVRRVSNITGRNGSSGFDPTPFRSDLTREKPWLQITTSDSSRHDFIKIFKDVRREFDEFRVNTDTCELRCWYL